MSLVMFTIFCNHYSYIYLKHFYQFKQKFCLVSYSPFPLPEALVMLTLLYFPMNFPIVDTSCKWHHAIFVLWCITYSLSIMCSRSTHSVTCIRSSFPFLWLNNILLHVYTTVVYRFICLWTLRLLIPFGYCENVAVNLAVISKMTSFYSIQ